MLEYVDNPIPFFRKDIDETRVNYTFECKGIPYVIYMKIHEENDWLLGFKRTKIIRDRFSFTEISLVYQTFYRAVRDFLDSGTPDAVFFYAFKGSRQLARIYDRFVPTELSRFDVSISNDQQGRKYYIKNNT